MSTMEPKMAFERREEARLIVQAWLQRDMDRAAERLFQGWPASRTFVCQGCGEAKAILHGRSVKCGICGVTSSAEVLAPGQ